MTLTSDLPYWELYTVATRPHPQHLDRIQLHVYYPMGYKNAVDRQRDIDDWIERMWGFNGVQQLNFQTLDELDTYLDTLVRYDDRLGASWGVRPLTN